jgi:proline iminopeptidase
MFYAIEYPSNLGSLILVDPDAASYELRTPYQIKTINSRITEEQWEYLDSISESPAFKAYDPVSYNQYYKTYLTSYFANPKDTSKLTLGFDSISIKKIDATNNYVRKGLGKYDIHDQLSRIICPTLILQGTESVFSVEGAEAIHNELINSELQLFENCGHFEYIESPANFKNSIINFYNKY